MLDLPQKEIVETDELSESIPVHINVVAKDKEYWPEGASIRGTNRTSFWGDHSCKGDKQGFKNRETDEEPDVVYSFVRFIIL